MYKRQAPTSVIQSAAILPPSVQFLTAENTRGAEHAGQTLAQAVRDAREVHDHDRGIALRGHPAQARQMIRKLLVGRLTFTPDEDERGRFYGMRIGCSRFEGRCLLEPW